jgi:lipopolysaccharide exporter
MADSAGLTEGSGLGSGTAAADGASILTRTARGASWMIGWRLATRVLGVFSTLILVRFLAPADFGVVALGTAFVASVEALTFIGVDDALVREKDISRAHYDTAFTLNLIRGAVLSVILAALAVPAAGFFAEPRITNVLLFLALGCLIDAFNNTGMVEYRRQFAFHREFLQLIVPRLVGLILMIGTAIVFHSYWALVVGVTSGRLLSVIASYVLHPFRPRPSLGAWRTLGSYSLWSWVTAWATLVRERSNAFMLGHVMGPAQVGIYAMGSDLALLPTTELVGPFARAAFSGFTAARNQGDQTAGTFLRMIGGVMMVSLPAGFGLSLLADPLVRLAFGQAWTGGVVVVQILGAAGALSVYSYLASTFLSAHALLATVLRITATVALVRLALLFLLLIVWPLGLLGSSIAVAASVLCGDALCVLVMRRRFQVGLGLLLSELWRCFVATAAMTAVLLASGLGGHPMDGPASIQTWHLLVGTLVGAASYIATLLTCWHLAGRPDGGETHVLRFLGTAIAGVGTRLRRVAVRRA